MILPNRGFVLPRFLVLALSNLGFMFSGFPVRVFPESRFCQIEFSQITVPQNRDFAEPGFCVRDFTNRGFVNS